jgi:hypothetical protein
MVKIMVSASSEGHKGLEPGIYNARCDLIADLGMQETDFGIKPKIYIRFAVPDQVLEDQDGNKFQMSIGRSVTASLSKKSNLRKMLEGWRGKPFTDEELKAFEITKLLNAPATLVVATFVTPSGEERSKIENVLRCKAEVGTLLRTPAAYSAESSNKELEDAPEWIRTAIQAGQKGGTDEEAELELQRQHEAACAATDEDDIPF